MGRLRRRSLGRQFGWLWASFAVSTGGTWLAFNAFPLIAITVLHAGPAAVSALAAAGLAVGAVVATPLGPWLEFRRKRPVMIGADLVRFVAMASVPAAYLLGWLSFGQLVVVAVLAAAADMTFTAASGACLKSLVAPEDLLVANGRFESTQWTATALGPPLGGAAIGLLGPVVTVLADAVSFLLSAAGIRAIGGTEPAPTRTAATRFRARDLVAGWRFVLAAPVLRALFLNRTAVNTLILAPEPLVAVLMLGQLGFPPWQYGLAFAVPCVGGLVVSRLAPRLVDRFGQRRVLLVAGTARAVWPIGLAFIGPGTPGLVLVIVVELGLIACSAAFNPVLATFRLQQTPDDQVGRTLTAWAVSSKAAIAAATALWGGLAVLIGPRGAIAVAGVLLLFTPLLLPWRAGATAPGPAAPVSAGR